MKTFAKFIVGICICFTGVITTICASGELDVNEKKVLDALKTGVDVDGKIVNLDTSYIISAENYFMKDGVSLNDAQTSMVLDQINASKKVVSDNKIIELATMPKKYQDQILAYAQTAANELGIILVVDYPAKTVTVKDKNGKVLMTASKVIKNTGDDFTSTLALSAAIAVLLAASGIVAAKKGLFEK